MVVALAPVFTSVEPCAGYQSRAAQTQEAQSIDDVVTRALSSTITPGAVVAVIIGDSLAFLRAYGRTGDDNAEPLTADALFQAGAVAELVNALAAALMAHNGEVRLDAPVGGLVPELPQVLGRATLAQLLTHTGGLALQPAAPGRGGADDLGAAARQLTQLDRVTDPGMMYSTSLIGISLAGLVLERATKRPYAQLMRALILEPLGMTHSTFDFATARSQLTAGYQGSPSPDRPFQQVRLTAPAAVRMPIDGLYSTASDLGRLTAALLNDGVVGGQRVLPEGVATELLAPRVQVPASDTRVGLGTTLQEWQTRAALRVAGGAHGYGFLLHLLTQERVGVIVLTNKTGVTLDVVSSFVFRRLLRMEEAPRQSAVSTPADSASLAELVNYPGRYLNGSELIEIVVRDGRPLFKSDTLVHELRPLPGGALGVVAYGQIVLSFRLLKDASGQPYLWLRQRLFGRKEN